MEQIVAVFQLFREAVAAAMMVHHSTLIATDTGGLLRSLRIIQQTRPLEALWLVTGQV